MSATLIDGVAIAAHIKTQVKTRVQALAARGITPGLTVIIVGDNPASRVYVRNKIKTCGENGIHSELIELPVETHEDALLMRIFELNAAPHIHGILVQLPLPKHINANRVIEAIAPEKDCDGFHVASAGALMTGLPGFWPCTPHGVMKMLEHTGIQPSGKHAVVLGRSNIVGKPMALMLLQTGATVTICHSKTPDLGVFTRQADILVAAVGQEKLITASMVKPGATVIDVAINRNAEGKLCGDVDFAAVREVAGAITPVPGGVGPMTIAMLLVNTVEAAERAVAA
jgi:methylenetetrahydrofolate dehydrogenase (NADP+) / methenyltetrahydrofolate cyclohydrolase